MRRPPPTTNLDPELRAVSRLIACACSCFTVVFSFARSVERQERFEVVEVGALEERRTVCEGAKVDFLLFTQLLWLLLELDKD
jgi:hypothetical protein